MDAMSLIETERSLFFYTKIVLKNRFLGEEKVLGTYE